MKRKLKKIVEIVFSAGERLLYSVGVILMCRVVAICFSSIATIAGWNVLIYFFGGLTAAAIAIALLVALGIAIPFKFPKTSKKTKQSKNSITSETVYGKLEKDENYTMYLNG